MKLKHLNSFMPYFTRIRSYSLAERLTGSSRRKSVRVATATSEQKLLTLLNLCIIVPLLDSLRCCCTRTYSRVNRQNTSSRLMVCKFEYNGRNSSLRSAWNTWKRTTYGRSAGGDAIVILRARDRSWTRLNISARISQRLTRWASG